MTILEHINITVSDGPRTAKWMQDVFGWHIRWQGRANNEQGATIHIGTDTHYVALYTHDTKHKSNDASFVNIGAMNHIAVVTDDLATMDAKVRAAGFERGEHQHYEPGHRFYFWDHDGIEFEVVQYD
ncbi:MAG: VOC family protein [Pseudomonadota bacterium]